MPILEALRADFYALKSLNEFQFLGFELFVRGCVCTYSTKILIWLVAIFEGTLAHSNCLSSMLPSKEGQAGLDVMVGTWLCEQRRYLSLAL